MCSYGCRNDASQECSDAKSGGVVPGEWVFGAKSDPPGRVQRGRLHGRPAKLLPPAFCAISPMKFFWKMFDAQARMLRLRRIFASVTAEEKEGEGGRRRKRRRGRKKERERRKRRKEEGRRGGGPFSNPLSLLNMCVKSCASFSVNTRCRCYCFPRGTSLLHFLLPAFALLQLPATAASHAPTSSPTRTSIASFNTTFRLLLPPHLCYLVLSISVSLEVSIPIHWVISDI